jgi:hypothetical protein
MSDRDGSILPFEDGGDADCTECEEIAEILASLRMLAEKSSHPVVRACLEQTHEDIAHLTSCADPEQADEEETATA